MTEAQIEEYIRKYAEGTASEEEVRALMDWYRQSLPGEVVWPSESGERERMRQQMLLRLTDGIAPKHAKIFTPSFLRIAAVFILVAGVALASVYYLNTKSPSYITLSNPSGKIQRARLPDNSEVWLNAATTLEYRKDFTEHRELRLKGEAFFEVSHDAAHPFRISTGEVKTTVRGTSFNIRAYEEDSILSIAVATGRVQVRNEKEELAVLSPALQLQYNRKNVVGIIKEIDTASIAAWKEGILRFDGMALSDIAHTLERWYGVRFVFTDPAISNCRYYMSFAASERLEQILSSMTEIAGIRYTIDTQSKSVSLSGKPCQ